MEGHKVEKEADIEPKRLPREEENAETELPAAKRAKLEEEDEEDDFGPALPSSTNASGNGAASSDNKAAWAKVRLEAEIGEVSAIDEMLNSSDRAEWMTSLPPERVKSATLDFDKMQRSVTAFSKRGMQRRGDTSSWTDTPADKQARESGSAKMSTLDMARQMAAQRFEIEENLEARQSSASFNSGERVMSLYEQVKTGAIKKDSKSSKREYSDSESDSESSDSSYERRRSHKHKKKEKHKDKGRDKDKSRDKDKRRDKDKERHRKKEKKRKRDDYDEQTPKAMTTADAFKGKGYWDRERDLDRFGARDSEQSRAQTFRDAAMLNSRFYSGGVSGSQKR